MNQITTTIQTTPVIIATTISQTIPADQVQGLTAIVASLPTQGSVTLANYQALDTYVSPTTTFPGMRLLSANLYDTSNGGEELLSDAVVQYDYTRQAFTFSLGYPLTNAKIIYRLEKA